MAVSDSREVVIEATPEEILAVIARHVPLEPENVRVRMERGETMSTLEVEVDIPATARLRLALTG